MTLQEAARLVEQARRTGVARDSGRRGKASVLTVHGNASSNASWPQGSNQSLQVSVTDLGVLSSVSDTLIVMLETPAPIELQAGLQSDFDSCGPLPAPSGHKYVCTKVIPPAATPVDFSLSAKAGQQIGTYPAQITAVVGSATGSVGQFAASSLPIQITTGVLVFGGGKGVALPNPGTIAKPGGGSGTVVSVGSAIPAGTIKDVAPKEGCYPLPQGAVFRFDPDKQGPYKDDIGGLQATVGTGLTLPGRYGGTALQVNGQIVFPDHPNIAMNKAGLTVEATIIPDADESALVFDKRELRWAGTGTAHGYRLFLLDSTPLQNGGISILFSGSAGTSGPGVQSALPSLGWHHVTVTRNFLDGTVKLYLNGQLFNVNSSLGNFDIQAFWNNAPLRIGGGGLGHGHVTVDHLVIYDRALSSAEIAGMHNKPKCS